MLEPPAPDVLIRVDGKRRAPMIDGRLSVARMPIRRLVPLPNGHSETELRCAVIGLKPDGLLECRHCLIQPIGSSMEEERERGELNRSLSGCPSPHWSN